MSEGVMAATIGDHVVGPAHRGLGRPKKLTDAELMSLAVVGARSEHHWLRMCFGRLNHLFPYLESVGTGRLPWALW